MTEGQPANRPPGWHRAAVGGLWEKVGQLQFDFLVRQGLRSDQLLLDIGCGALRGGIHFVRYLEVGHYCGVDKDEELLEAGREELALAGLTARNPDLRCDASFDLPVFGRRFDFVLAQSLFTHLPLNSILRCVEAVSTVLAPGGGLYATFFENRHGSLHFDPIDQPRIDGEPQVSYPDRDPYHYDVDALRWAGDRSGLRLAYIGEWGHPRSQMMVVFRPAAGSLATAVATR